MDQSLHNSGRNYLIFIMDQSLHHFWQVRSSPKSTQFGLYESKACRFQVGLIWRTPQYKDIGGRFAVKDARQKHCIARSQCNATTMHSCRRHFSSAAVFCPFFAILVSLCHMYPIQTIIHKYIRKLLLLCVVTSYINTK